MSAGKRKALTFWLLQHLGIDAYRPVTCGVEEYLGRFRLAQQRIIGRAGEVRVWCTEVDPLVSPAHAVARSTPLAKVGCRYGLLVADAVLPHHSTIRVLPRR